MQHLTAVSPALALTPAVGHVVSRALSRTRFGLTGRETREALALRLSVVASPLSGRPREERAGFSRLSRALRSGDESQIADAAAWTLRKDATLRTLSDFGAAHGWDCECVHCAGAFASAEVSL